MKLHMNSDKGMRTTMSDFKSTTTGFAKKANEETFVTMGSENPMQICDNCGKSIQASKFQLHYNFCLKNVTKCPFCNDPVQISELQSHIDESQGTPETIKEAIETADIKKL